MTSAHYSLTCSSAHLHLPMVLIISVTDCSVEHLFFFLSSLLFHTFLLPLFDLLLLTEYITLLPVALWVMLFPLSPIRPFILKSQQARTHTSTNKMICLQECTPLARSAYEHHDFLLSFLNSIISTFSGLLVPFTVPSSSQRSVSCMLMPLRIIYLLSPLNFYLFSSCTQRSPANRLQYFADL